MKYTYLVLILASLLLFSGCLSGDTNGSYDYGEEYGDMAYESAPMASEANFLGAGTDLFYDSNQKMVIKEGSISVDIETGMMEEKKQELSNLLVQYDAEVSSINFDEYTYEKTYAVTVKLTPEKFDAFVNSVSNLGEITSMDTTLEDVTEQYMDLQKRIENLEEELTRLNGLYDQADEIGEILLIEQEVTRVQTELEVYQMQAIDLERRTAKSTLTIYLTEEKPALEKDFMIPLGEILNLFLGAISFGIMVIVGLGGFIIPIAIVVLVLKKLYEIVTKKGRR